MLNATFSVIFKYCEYCLQFQGQKPNKWKVMMHSNKTLEIISFLVHWGQNNYGTMFIFITQPLQISETQSKLTYLNLT